MRYAFRRRIDFFFEDFFFLERRARKRRPWTLALFRKCGGTYPPLGFTTTGLTVVNVGNVNIGTGDPLSGLKYGDSGGFKAWIDGDSHMGE